MVVRIREPHKRGDKTRIVSLEQAREEVDKRLQEGWIAAIDHRMIQDARRVQEGDEVSLYPGVGGG